MIVVVREQEQRFHRRNLRRDASRDESDNDTVNSTENEPVQKGHGKSASAGRPRLRHAQGEVKRVLRRALGAYKVRWSASRAVWLECRLGDLACGETCRS